MSNDKFEATYHGGYRADQDWPQPMAGHGAAEPDPATDRTYYRSPGRPPWDNQVHQDLAVQHGWPAPGEQKLKSPRILLWIVFVLVLGLVLALASILVERSGVVPAGVPVIGQDKGLAVCEAMASEKNPAGDTKGEELTLEQVREVRSYFAASRYAEIREPGIKLMDLAAQMAGLGEDEMGAGALMFMTSFTENYAALSGGCAQHGYEIPKISA